MIRAQLKYYENKPDPDEEAVKSLKNELENGQICRISRLVVKDDELIETETVFCGSESSASAYFDATSAARSKTFIGDVPALQMNDLPQYEYKLDGKKYTVTHRTPLSSFRKSEESKNSEVDGHRESSPHY